MEIVISNPVYILLSLILLAGYAYWAWRRLDQAFLAMIGLLPCYLIRFNLGGVPTTWLEMMILCLLAVFVVKQAPNILANVKANFKKKRVASRYPFDVEMSLWLALGLLGALVAGCNLGAYGIWKAYFFEAIAVYLLFVNILGRDGKWVKAIWALTASAFVIALVAWYQQLVDMSFWNPIWSQQTTPRATSVFPYANAVGLYLAPLIILMATLLKSLSADLKNNLKKIILLTVVIVLSLGAIIFARSEGAVIAVAIGLVLLLAGTSKLMLKSVAVVSVIAMVILISWPVTREYGLEKIQMTDLSGEIRKVQWLETKNMLMSNPLTAMLGVGLNNYPSSIRPFHQEGIFYNFDKLEYLDFRNKIVNGDPSYKTKYWQPVEIYQYPHNIILNFWVELGILGVLLMLWLVGKFWYYCWMIYRQGNAWGWGLAVTMVTVLIHGWVDVPYFKNDLAVLWWILFAMVAVIKINYEYERSTTKNNSK